jgi:hypothetical protein
MTQLQRNARADRIPVPPSTDPQGLRRHFLAAAGFARARALRTIATWT